ncbi:MAG: 6-phosphogluconolactonase [Marinobacter sp.]|nr:6-phosphogluconolactonase [Marinobacter sp.]
MKMSELHLPDGIESHVGQTPNEVGEQLADAVAGFLAERLSSAPRASLVVSGGSTPLPFFHALCRKQLEWDRVDVVLADERWVPEDDPASNTALVKEHLLRDRAIGARFLPLKHPGATPEEGLAEARRCLAGLIEPPDVVVLGMGNDGHTASLFPDAPELSAAMDPDNDERVVVATPASQPQRRITLTYRFLSSARFVALHLRGEDKLATLLEAMAHTERVMEMPVRGFLRPGLKIYWSPS